MTRSRYAHLIVCLAVALSGLGVLVDAVISQAPIMIAVGVLLMVLGVSLTWAEVRAHRKGKLRD